MLSAEDLDREKPAAQRTTVEKWVAWRRAGDPRAAGFWTAGCAVASARFLGSDAKPLVRALGVFVRRGPRENLVPTLNAVRVLFGTAAKPAAVGLPTS